MGITDTQSYSLVIRDALFAKLLLEPFFANFFSRRCKQLPVQPQQVPYLGVYIVDEGMEPDGDANAGEIRFRHSLRVGFSVLIENNDPVQAELKLDQAFWTIMNSVWRDPHLTNFILSSLPDNVRFEGVTRGHRRHVWGNAGFNNEKPIAELQYDAWIMYRASYPVIVTDDLLHIHVETVPLAGDDTIPPADAVQRIISEYEFTPAKGRTDDDGPTE